MRRDKKYHYDEQDGIFIFEDEISVNWLLSQILQSELQITKISNEQLQLFLSILSKSDLRMPDGEYCLFWLRKQIKEKMEMSDSKTGQSAYDLTIRYRYILENIDNVLSEISDISEKMDIKKENIYKSVDRAPNNMQAYFEPISDKSSGPVE